MTRVVLAVALALALAGCADTKLWMRSGASAIDADFDRQDCAVRSEGGSSITFDNGGGAGGPKFDSFSNRYGCLRNRGYRLVSVTNEEADRLHGLTGAAKGAYWNELMTKYGVEPAAEPASQPAAVDPPR